MGLAQSKWRSHLDRLKRENYTSTQVKTLDKKQVAILLGEDEKAFFWDGNNAGYYSALISHLLTNCKVKEQQVKMDKIKQLLKNEFPKCDIEVGRCDDALSHYLAGKPKEEIV